MLEEYGYNDFEEQRAQASAEEFERMLQSNQFQFMDISTIDEVFHHYLRFHELEKAEQLIRYAIRSYPANGELHHKQARLEAERGNYAEALDSIETALAFSPTLIDLLLFKSDLLARLDRYEEAIELLDRWAFLSERPEEVLLQKGNLAQISGRVEESEGFYREALALSPDFEEALFELGFLLESVDKTSPAIALYDKYLETSPYSAGAWFNLGLMHRKVGNYELALDALEYASLIQEDFTSAHYNRGQVLLDLGRPYEALAAFLEAQAHFDSDPQTAYAIAECYESLGESVQAARYYRLTSELDPDFLDAWLGLGYAMEQMERYTDAIYWYERALDLDGENTEVCLSLAICEYKLGDPHKAFEYLHQAITLNPQDLTLWQDWAELLFEDHNEAGAIVYLEEALRHLRNEAELYYQLAAYCFAANESPKALNYLEQGLILDPAGYYLLFIIDPSLRFEPSVQELIGLYA